MLVKGLQRTYWLEGVTTGRDVVQLLAQKQAEGWMQHADFDVKLLQNGRYLDTLDSVLGPAPVQVVPCNPPPGGKGGFGSMLRSIGAQIERTTNHEAMRDLSGRRQKDVNNE